MNVLAAIASKDDIFPQYRDTPISLLLEYHNLNRQFEVYDNAKLLIGMCMDNRKHLHIPDNFAFIIRSGGANLRYSAFMMWVTANIGYHHIHHLNAKIPFYRLPEAMASIPELQHATKISLKLSDIIACFRLKVWDSQNQEMIGLKKLYATGK